MANPAYFGTYFYVRLEASESATNPSGNSSTVLVKVWAGCTGTGSYFTNDQGNICTVTINGTAQNIDIAGYYSFSQSEQKLGEKSLIVAHDTNGSKTGVAVSAYLPTGMGSATATGSIDLTNFTRLPTTPTFASGPTRTLDSVSFSLSTVTNYGTGLTYKARFNKDSAGYTDLKSSTGTAFTYPSLVKGSSYVFQGYANDTEGDSTAVVSSAIGIPTVPGAPASLSATTPAGRSCVVTVGNSSTGTVGTSVISAASLTYYLQSSKDDGVTWRNNAGTLNGSDTLSTTSGAHAFTYTDMDGGATYRFRAWAVNEMGAGAFIDQPSPYTFVPAAGQKYNGTTFVNIGTAKRYDPSVTASDGTHWIPLTRTQKYKASRDITNVVDNGTTVTYTADHNFEVGDVVTITGVLPTAYNLTNATVTSVVNVNGKGTSFTITTTATGTYQASTGKAVVGWVDFV